MSAKLVFRPKEGGEAWVAQLGEADFTHPIQSFPTFNASPTNAAVSGVIGSRRG